MTAVLTNKNSWGDPLLLVHGRTSKLAAAALAISLAIMVSAVATLGLAGLLQGPWRAPALAIMVLLTVFQFVFVPIAFILAYIVLCTCRIGTAVRGRGLAWTALGLGYVAVVCRLALAAMQFGVANWALVALLVFGAVHALMFAAESRFAKSAVTTLAIAAVFLSLLGPWILYSREHARRLQCMDRLRQIGLHLHESQNAGHPEQTASLKATASDQTIDKSYMRSLFESIEPASGVYTLPAQSQGNALRLTPTWQVEKEQLGNSPVASP